MNKYPGLPLLLAGHGLGAAEVLAFCARWSKSQQARCVRGILAFAPGFGEVKFACDARKLHDSLSPVYNSLVLVGTVSAESVADVVATVFLKCGAAAMRLSAKCGAGPQLEECAHTVCDTVNNACPRLTDPAHRKRTRCVLRARVLSGAPSTVSRL